MLSEANGMGASFTMPRARGEGLQVAPAPSFNDSLERLLQDTPSQSSPQRSVTVLPKLAINNERKQATGAVHSDAEASAQVHVRQSSSGSSGGEHDDGNSAPGLWSWHICCSHCGSQVRHCWERA